MVVILILFLNTPAWIKAEEFIFDPLPAADLVPIQVSARVLLDSGQVQLDWSGTGILQSAAQIGGEWTSVSRTSPVRAKLQESQFFRILSASRPVSVFIPSSYKRESPMPLVLSLHGTGGNAATQEGRIPLRPFAESAGFIYCLPEGTINSNGNSFWNDNEAWRNVNTLPRVDDVAYLKAIIERVSQAYSVDRKRIYVVGYSNGGLMAYRMACEQSELIAGIVSFAGPAALDTSTYHPTSPVNILHIHGTSDANVKYAGGYLLGSFDWSQYPGAAATIEIWAKFNGCQSKIVDEAKTMDLDLNVSG